VHKDIRRMVLCGRCRLLIVFQEAGMWFKKLRRDVGVPGYN